MSRPVGKPKQYATDETFVAPGEAWDAAPAKVEPSAGVIAAGLYQPEQAIASGYANHRDHDFARRLLDLDAIEIRNWIAPCGTDNGLITVTSSNTTVAIGAHLWHPAAPLVFVANENDILESTDGGYNWTATFSPLSAVFRGLAFSPNESAAIYEIAGAGYFATVSDAAAWAGEALSGCTQANAITYDPTEDVFWIVGEHSTTGGIWRTVANGTIPTTTTLVDTGVADPFEHVAAGTEWKLFANQDVVWRAPNASFVPVAATAPQGGGVNINELRWLPEDEVFILIAHAGAACECYVSSDGVTWTDRTANLPADFQGLGSNALRTSAVRGSIFAMVGELDGAQGILWTGDAGLTWEWVPDPIARHSNAVAAVQRLGIGDRQWLAIAYRASGEHLWSGSLRMGA